MIPKQLEDNYYLLNLFNQFLKEALKKDFNSNSLSLNDWELILYEFILKTEYWPIFSN